MTHGSGKSESIARDGFAAAKPPISIADTRENKNFAPILFQLTDNPRCKNGVMYTAGGNQSLHGARRPYIKCYVSGLLSVAAYVQNRKNIRFFSCPIACRTASGSAVPGFSFSTCSRSPMPLDQREETAPMFCMGDPIRG